MPGSARIRIELENTVVSESPVASKYVDLAEDSDVGKPPGRQLYACLQARDVSLSTMMCGGRDVNGPQDANVIHKEWDSIMVCK